MRLFVIWADKSLEFVNLLSELKKRHEVIYWLGYDDSEIHRLPGTIFHSYKDAILGIPAAGIDLFEFSPPEEELIKKLARAESLVLTMMSRFFYKEKSADERRHLYYRMLRYWHGLLKKYQPDLIIFSDVPHYVYDFVIYELARLLGIKIQMFLDTRIPGRLFYFENWWDGSAALKEELRRNYGKDFSLSDLADDVRHYYETYADKNLRKLPSNVRYQRGKYSILQNLFPTAKIWTGWKDFSIFKKVGPYLRRLFRNGPAMIKEILKQISYLFKDNLKKEYQSVQSPPDFNKKFIYVPLHFQPECSTSPQGDMFADQILMVETLSAALPEGWLIYVKEHPMQWFRRGLDFFGYKYPGYYREIAKIDKVRLVPIETNSYDLISRSRAVAAIAGAAGWEALLRSKPTIIFGYPWYKDFPGLLRANDVATCRKALEKIAAGHSVNPPMVFNFLKSLENATIRGYIAASAGNESGISKAECMKNIVEFLLKKLNNK